MIANATEEGCNRNLVQVEVLVDGTVLLSRPSPDLVPDGDHGGTPVHSAHKQGRKYRTRSCSLPQTQSAYQDSAINE